MSKSAAPFFSVIVPVYNNENDLEKCIESILSQTYKNFELILVNDGSTDRSPQICDKFAAIDRRVQVIHKEKNTGVVAARNDGLFHASGKYIYHVDGDDWIAQELLKKASQVLDTEDPPDIFAFCFQLVQEDNYIKRKLKIEEGMYDRERLEKEIFPDLICTIRKTIERGKCSASLADKIIARKLLEKHYCKDTTLFRGEDSVCSYECMYNANKVYFSKEALYFYNRDSSSSTMSQYHADLYEGNKAVANYLRKHLRAGDDFQLERQIKASEFRGVLTVVHQEVDFKHSIHDSTRFLKEKCKDEKKICSYKGLPLFAYPYVFLLNRRCFTFLLLSVRVEYFLLDIWHAIKGLK